MKNRYLATDKLVVGTAQKEVDEVKDAVIDYTKLLSRLGADTIATSTWLEDSGDITIDSESETTLQTTLWYSSGSHNNTYDFENTIVTAAGRTIKKVLRVKVTESSTVPILQDYV